MMVKLPGCLVDCFLDTCCSWSSILASKTPADLPQTGTDCERAASQDLHWPLISNFKCERVKLNAVRICLSSLLGRCWDESELFYGAARW